MPVDFSCDECGRRDRGTLSRFGYGIKPENWKLKLNHKARVICPICIKLEKATLR